MSQSRVSLVHKGQRQDFEIRTGLGFQALAAQHPEAALEFDCRASDCGVCLIEVVEGADQLSPKKLAEADFLKAMMASENERLACQCRILGPVTVLVPEA